MSKPKFEWDGEKVKQVVVQEEKKHTPKDILNSLAHVRNQISQMQNQQLQLEQQAKTNEANIKSASKFESELKPFEDKCIELQKEKLQLYIKQLHQVCYDAADKSSRAVVAKDPNVHNVDSRVNIAYLDYQKALATNEKVAKNIAKEIVVKYLYDEPIFDNPFLTTSKD